MDAADTDVRQRLMQAVSARPGIHLRDLQRSVGISLSGIIHHLRVLEHEAAVVGISDGHYKRYFSSNLVLPAEARRLSDDDRRLLAELRRPMSLGIVLNLAVDDRLGHAELRRRLGKSKSTISYHVSRLASSGIVRLVRESSTETYELVDKDRATALLVTFSSAFRDRIDAFADLWHTLGRRNAGGIRPGERDPRRN